MQDTLNVAPDQLSRLKTGLGHSLGQVIHDPSRAHSGHLLSGMRCANGQHPSTTGDPRLNTTGGVLEDDAVLNGLAELFCSSVISVSRR